MFIILRRIQQDMAVNLRTAVVQWLRCCGTNQKVAGSIHTEVVHLIPYSSTAMVLAGDLNCVMTDDDCTGQWNFSRALCENHTGTGPHRRMEDDLDTLHCYWRFQDWLNLRYSWPKEEATICGDGDRWLHGPFCSNPALDHGCTMLPPWEKVLAN